VLSLPVLAAAIVLATFTAWLIRRHSSWIATKVALTLCGLYALLLVGLLLLESFNRQEGQVESASGYLLILGPLVLVPILVIGVIIDLILLAFRRPRSSGNDSPRLPSQE
jgi:hypothetical protein